VIVTGGAAGIGVETARALAVAGAEVTLAVRNTDAGQHVASQIVATAGNTHVLIAPLDLADRASVASFVAAWDGPLAVLVNNAGVMAPPDLQLTPQGWEITFATNHLGHFALALGLHDALSAGGDARIVSVGSVGHRRSPVIFDDLNFTSRPYDPGPAYGQSKTANVLFAVEATRRWGSEGITANAVHPGTITATNLNRHLDPDVVAALRVSAPYAEAFAESTMRRSPRYLADRRLRSRLPLDRPTRPGACTSSCRTTPLNHVEVVGPVRARCRPGRRSTRPFRLC
jgi:NAD(P)-dependent dehydrogenase (short-subunit alcohol dehydrogenase family)